MRHVREGEGHIARQRELVDSLPLEGELAETGRDLLAQFEDMQEMHLAHLARLLNSN